MPRFNKNFHNHPYLKSLYVHFAFYLINSLILSFIFGFIGIYCHLTNLFILLAGVIFSRRLRIIGLTGQACSGKSTTARYLSEKYGSSVILIDEINKEVITRKEVLDEIKAKFGNIVFTESGELNKLRLRDIIYG